jgi:hypothetical protein
LYKGKRGPTRFATDQIEEGPKVDGMMSMEVLEQRRKEMLREAELNRLKKALRAEHRRSAISRWATALKWELARAVGLLRKFFRMPNNPDKNRQRGWH